MTDNPHREAEIERIAYHLWVLAKMPDGGPDQFREEAEEIIARRVRRELNR